MSTTTGSLSRHLQTGERDVRVRGRVSPPLAGELNAVAARLAAVSLDDIGPVEASAGTDR